MTTTSSQPCCDDYWSAPTPNHPKMVHLPLALCMLMPMVGALVLFGLRRAWFTTRVWLIAAFLQGALLAGGIAALVTGEQDGDKVEGYASDEALERHETYAYRFVYLAGVNFLLCGGAFLLHRDRRRQQIVAVIAIVGMAAGGYAGYLVGDAGGRLVYVGNATDAHR